MKKIITNSMRNEFLDCPYRFFLNYVRRLTPIKQPRYFKFGSLYHACREKLDNELPITDVIEEAHREAEESGVSATEAEETESLCTEVPRMAEAHMLKWHEEDKNFEQVGTERKFSIPLPSGWTFEGKVDKLARDIRNGEIFIFETKTASQLNDMFWAQKELDSQPLGYCLGSQRGLGIQVRKVKYDVAQKLKLRQKKNETRETFQKRVRDTYLLRHQTLFERRTFTFSQEDIDRYAWDINAVTQMMDFCIANAYYPHHCPSNRFGRCLYQSICLRGDENKFYIRSEDKLTPELPKGKEKKT